MTRLLAVDDEPSIRRCLARVLPGHGFEVACVETGAEALGRALGDFVEVVLLDRFLVGEDGLEVCETLRGLGYVGLIILMTGDYSVETHVRGLEIGADDFIKKPLEIELLVAQVRAGLRRKSNHFLVTFGGLTIDLGARAADLDGEHMELTELETDLLCYLAVRAGKIVPWEILIRDVWGKDRMSDLAAVRVAVTRLREKLGRERDRVETVRGVGLGFRK